MLPITSCQQRDDSRSLQGSDPGGESLSHLQNRSIGDAAHPRATGDRTQGHAFVVMLAYPITQELAKRWSRLNLTVREGINQLTTICSQEVLINGKPHCHKIPQPDRSLRRLFEAAGIRLPDVLANKGVDVTIKKKLQKRRIAG